MILSLLFTFDYTFDYTFYRPISLISNISKLLEKLVHERLYSFFEKKNFPFKDSMGLEINIQEQML